MGHYSQDRTRFLLPGELEGLWWLLQGSWGRGARAVDARGRPWPTLEMEMERHGQDGPAGHWPLAGMEKRQVCSPPLLPLAPLLSKVHQNQWEFWQLEPCVMSSESQVWDLVYCSWGENNSRKNDVCNRWFGDHPTGKVLFLEGKANAGAEFLNFLTPSS